MRPIPRFKRMMLRAPKILRAQLKLAAFISAIAGVLLLWADFFGMFRDSEKEHFAEVVMNTQAFIPRDMPGFEVFLKAFPPPPGFSAAQVTGIADKELRIASTSDVGHTVRYVVGMRWTSPVARFDQVKDWAEKTMVEPFSIVLATVGFLILLPVEIYEYRQSRGKRT